MSVFLRRRTEVEQRLDDVHRTGVRLARAHRDTTRARKRLEGLEDEVAEREKNATAAREAFEKAGGSRAIRELRK